MSPDTGMPPALFDLDEPKPERKLYNADNPFKWACSDCGRKVTGDDYVGGGSANGSWLLCGPCAAKDGNYGVTASGLAAGKIRRSVYSAGGGETDVAIALKDAGLLTCAHTWPDTDHRVGHPIHLCVFRTKGPHTRHECLCGLNAYGELP